MRLENNCFMCKQDTDKLFFACDVCWIGICAKCSRDVWSHIDKKYYKTYEECNEWDYKKIVSAVKDPAYICENCLKWILHWAVTKPKPDFICIL